MAAKKDRSDLSFDEQLQATDNDNNKQLLYLSVGTVLLILVPLAIQLL